MPHWRAEADKLVLRSDTEQRKGTDIYRVADREVETGEWTNEGQVQVIKQEGNTRAGSEESKMSIQNKTGNVQNQQKIDEQNDKGRGTRNRP